MNNNRFVPLILSLLLLTVTARKSMDVLMKTVFLRFYDGNTLAKYIDQPLDTASQLVASMDTGKPTVLYIHGFTESEESDSTRTVMRAYLARGDHNTMVVDYRNVSNVSYGRLVSSSDDVGKALAAALDQMVEAGLNPKTLHVVGHSMGSQIAGYIGRSARFRLQRITGLDPAGPLFNFLKAYLTSADAEFVDIIHTDYGTFGIARASGTVDFFPNGGHRLQPGCPSDSAFFTVDDFCSHRRSWAFYAESLLNEDSFVGIKCSSHQQFVNDECDVNDTTPMGYGVSRKARGNYYLITGSRSPYGLGQLGITHNATTYSKSAVNTLPQGSEIQSSGDTDPTQNIL